jgi:6-methylsalicylate decarboxylase
VWQHPGALDALLRIAPISNVLYGSDYPFRPVSEVTEGVNHYTFHKTQRQAIERDNVLRMLADKE